MKIQVPIIAFVAAGLLFNYGEIQSSLWAAGAGIALTGLMLWENRKELDIDEVGGLFLWMIGFAIAAAISYYISWPVARGLGYVFLAIIMVRVLSGATFVFLILIGLLLLFGLLNQFNLGFDQWVAFFETNILNSILILIWVYFWKDDVQVEMITLFACACALMFIKVLDVQTALVLGVALATNLTIRKETTELTQPTIVYGMLLASLLIPYEVIGFLAIAHLVWIFLPRADAGWKELTLSFVWAFISAVDVSYIYGIVTEQYILIGDFAHVIFIWLLWYLFWKRRRS